MKYNTRQALADAREERAGLFEQMKAITDKAESEGRAITSEEDAEWRRLDGELDKIGDDITRSERELNLGAEMSRDHMNRDRQPESTDGEVRAFDRKKNEWIDGPRAVRMVEERPTSSESYHRAFEALIRRRGVVGNLEDEHRAALQVGTDSEGGYLVPDEFHRQLVISEREFGSMRRLARIVTTGDNGELIIPKVATRATAVWLAEEAAFTQSEPTFGETRLGSFKAGAISKVSDELLLDSAFDILAFLAQDLGEALGLLENVAFVNGASGSTTTPEGIAKKGSVGKIFAVNSAITADELIDLFHSLLSPYRGNAVWMMRDSVVQSVRKLKSNDNQYLWQPGLVADHPDVLLGRPLVIDPDVEAIGANAESVVFGDIQRAYWIRDVEGISVKILNELYAANGQVGYRVHKRTDGDVVDTAAVKIGQHPA